MSDAKEPVTLEFLGARVAALTDGLHDMELRFTAMEARFSAMEGRLGALQGHLAALTTMVEIRIGALEQRFAAQEERQSRTLAILTRLAARIEGAP